MNLALIILMGVALLCLLIVAVRRNTFRSSGSLSVPDSSEYIVRLPSRALLDRCLSTEDVEFIMNLQSPPLLRLLLSERRRLALAWLRETRLEANRLLRMHGRLVRHAAGLRPIAEVALFAHVARFLVVYQILVMCVALYGAVHTRRFVQSVLVLADSLASVSGQIAESVGAGPVPDAVRH